MIRWLLIGMAWGLFARDATAQQYPNVVLILVEGADWADPANEALNTPFLDQLQQESVRFRQIYAGGSGASARAALLTGRYALRTGVSGAGHRREVMRSGEVTIAEVFKAAGYSTGIFGKWDNGAQYPNDPDGQGFDTFLGYKGEGVNSDVDPVLEKDGQPFRATGYLSDILMDGVVNFILNRSPQPFFCYLSLDVPDSSRQGPEAYAEPFKKAGLNDQQAAIYGMLENLDDKLGRLLRALDSLNIRDNTIIAFIAVTEPAIDQSNAPFRGAGLQGLCFVNWRNYLPPRDMPNPAADIDLLPTLTGLCGISLPDSLQIDGIHWNPMMQGAPDRTEGRPLFFQYPADTVSPYPGTVRWKTYSLVLPDKGKSELYDLVQDPRQQNNLSEQLPELARELEKAYLNWYRSVISGLVRFQPVPVGYPGHSETTLFAADCRRFTGSVRLEGGSGLPNERLSGLSSPLDTVVWDLEVRTPGKYAIQLICQASREFSGSAMQLESGPEFAAFRIADASDSRPVPPSNQQQGPEGEWKALHAGSIYLGVGQRQLRLLVCSPAKGNFSLHSIKLTLQKI